MSARARSQRSAHLGWLLWLVLLGAGLTLLEHGSERGQPDPGGVSERRLWLGRPPLVELVEHHHQGGLLGRRLQIGWARLLPPLAGGWLLCQALALTLVRAGLRRPLRAGLPLLALGALAGLAVGAVASERVWGHPWLRPPPDARLGRIQRIQAFTALRHTPGEPRLERLAASADELLARCPEGVECLAERALVQLAAQPGLPDTLPAPTDALLSQAQELLRELDPPAQRPREGVLLVLADPRGGRWLHLALAELPGEDSRQRVDELLARLLPERVQIESRVRYLSDWSAPLVATPPRLQLLAACAGALTALLAGGLWLALRGRRRLPPDTLV